MNVTLTSRVAVTPAVSVVVTRNVSVKFSLQLTLALNVAGFDPATPMRLPAMRAHAWVYGGVPPEAVGVTSTASVPGLGREPLTLGGPVTTSCAGVVKITLTSRVALLPALSVAVTRKVSVRFSDQFSVAANVAGLLPETVMRVPVTRVQLKP